MEMEEEGGEGLDRERGLEDTLEKLGMGGSNTTSPECPSGWTDTWPRNVSVEITRFMRVWVDER
jgi:hypothetical protein